MIRKIKIAICIFLCITSVFQISGCASRVQATDLTKGVSPNKVEKQKDLETYSNDFSDFAIRLLRESMYQSENQSKENVLISPISIMNTLAMAANGAKENTLVQMEDILGDDINFLNGYLNTYINSLPNKSGSKLRIANSIWFDETSGFIPNEAFLQINADYYDAGLYQTVFNDSAIKDMNQWVDEKTDGMISEIIDEFQDNSVMYLMDAVAFDAKWEEPYKRNNVWTGNFTLEDQSEKDVEYMSSIESVYLEDDLGKGFVKYYKNCDYGFAAILPRDGLTISEYLEQISGVQLYQMFINAKATSVRTYMPKFEIEYDMEMSKALINMGMKDGFDERQADFSGIGTGTEGNLYFSRILHKTFMSVDEKGTKAGAAISLAAKAEAIEDTEKYVYLNRPYIYMIIDCKYNIPIFIGMMMDVPLENK